jgi:hypothetical protein
MAAILHDIGRSWRALPAWVKIWLFFLNAVFLASPLVMAGDPGLPIVLGLYLASGPFLFAFMLTQRGLSRALGTAHLMPWVPLVLYLVFRLTGAGKGPAIHWNEEPLLWSYSLLLLTTVVICLAFDLYDWARWVRGDKALMG